MKNLQQLKELSQRLPTLKEVKAERSKRNFFQFVKYTKPDFIEGWFNKLIADALQQFYQDIQDGKQPRLMIFAPPRSGKSELFSRRFPAWVFGKNPDIQVIGASYSSDLSSRMNRDVQRIIDDPLYGSVFPNTKLHGKNVVTVSASSPLRNSDIFEIVNHTGSYRSAGVGGGITGMGADIGIIDDPIKDGQEANSVTVRTAVWEWYTKTFYTRLSPKSGILLGMTRWHEDDLAGRLLKLAESGEGDQWKVIRLPAIAEEDEEFRRAGEALHPERYPLDRLQAIKTAVGTSAWNALYQQRPTSLGGGLIKGSWFLRALYPLKVTIKYRKIYADTAQKAKEHNDYSVFQCWGYGDDGKIYLMDMIRGKWEAPELRKRAMDFWNKHLPVQEPYVGQLRQLLIEDKSSGTGLIQDIAAAGRIPVKGIERTKDKLTRVMDVVSYIEAGLVCLPENAPWVNDFIAECEAFSPDDSHAHDDQIDPMCDAINDMLTGARGIEVWNNII